MKESSMKSLSPVNPIFKKINKVIQPQNKIVGRLQAQMKCNSVPDPREAYSRMHNRHNRA